MKFRIGRYLLAPKAKQIEISITLGFIKGQSQPAIKCLELTIKTLEECVKYVQI